VITYSPDACPMSSDYEPACPMISYSLDLFSTVQ